MDEEHPLNPRSPYAATKAGADRLAYAYFVTYGLPIVIVRPFNNYGPRQHPEKVIPRFITQALDDEPLTIHGDGHATRDWLYVDDDAEAIEAIIDADLDAVAGEVINVATGVDLSGGGDRRPRPRGARQARVAEGARRRAARPGRPAHRLDGEGGAAARLERANVVRDGLERTVAWYRDNEAWWRGSGGSQRRRLLVLGAGAGAARAARRPRAASSSSPSTATRRRPASATPTGGRSSRSRTSTAIDRLAAAERVDGIIAPGIDWPVAIAARVAARLGLPHPLGARDGGAARVSKLKQRERLAEAGVPQPRWSVRRGRGRGGRRRARPPCVVKAPDRQGQRGLSLVLDAEDVAEAFGRALAARGAGGTVLVEKLVDGRELTVNAFSVGGRFHPLTVTDRVVAGAAGLRRRARARLAERAAAASRRRGRRAARRRGARRRRRADVHAGARGRGRPRSSSSRRGSAAATTRSSARRRSAST